MFEPPFCPRPRCPSRSQGGFTYQLRGSFRRALDQRSVQRYCCGVCKRFFSDQSFRLDYRLRRPALTASAFGLFAANVALLRTARLLHCARGTVQHRFELLGRLAAASTRVRTHA